MLASYAVDKALERLVEQVSAYAGWSFAEKVDGESCVLVIHLSNVYSRQAKRKGMDGCGLR